MRKGIREYEKIEPEHVQDGDTIEIVYSEKLGLTKRVRGVAHSRESYSSGFRTIYTQEGGELLSWHPRHPYGFAVFRIARAEKKQDTLPGLEIERLSA